MLRITRFFQAHGGRSSFVFCSVLPALQQYWPRWNKSSISAEIDCTEFSPNKQKKNLNFRCLGSESIHFFRHRKSGLRRKFLIPSKSSINSFNLVYLHLTVIRTYSLIPSRSLKSRLSSLRSKNPLLLMKTRCLGSWPLRMLFSWMWVCSLHSAWKPSCRHTSSCLGLNPQQLGSKRSWI